MLTTNGRNPLASGFCLYEQEHNKNANYGKTRLQKNWPTFGAKRAYMWREGERNGARWRGSDVTREGGTKPQSEDRQGMRTLINLKTVTMNRWGRYVLTLANIITFPQIGFNTLNLNYFNFSKFSIILKIKKKVTGGSSWLHITKYIFVIFV